MGSNVVSDQTEENRRKEICAGEDWRQCDVHHEETENRVSIQRSDLERARGADRRP